MAGRINPEYYTNKILGKNIKNIIYIIIIILGIWHKFGWMCVLLLLFILHNFSAFVLVYMQETATNTSSLGLFVIRRVLFKKKFHLLFIWI